MDDLRLDPQLSLAFLESSNELLSQTHLCDSFMLQWMEVLEERFDFGPLYFFLPIFGLKKIFTLSPVLEKIMEPQRNQRFREPAYIDSMVVYPLQGLEELNHFALREPLKSHELFPIFEKYAAFYVQTIHKIDSLGSRLKRANLSLELFKMGDEEPSESGLLDLLSGFLQNERVFLYRVEQERLAFPGETGDEVDVLIPYLKTALTQVLYERNLVARAEYAGKLKALILYPIFKDEEIVTILGSFSEKSPIITNNDLTVLSMFCSEPRLSSWLYQSSK